MLADNGSGRGFSRYDLLSCLHLIKSDKLDPSEPAPQVRRCRACQVLLQGAVEQRDALEKLVEALDREPMRAEANYYSQLGKARELVERRKRRGSGGATA